MSSGLVSETILIDPMDFTTRSVDEVDELPALTRNMATRIPGEPAGLIVMSCLGAGSSGLELIVRASKS